MNSCRFHAVLRPFLCWEHHPTPTNLQGDVVAPVFEIFSLIHILSPPEAARSHKNAAWLIGDPSALLLACFGYAFSEQEDPRFGGSVVFHHQPSGSEYAEERQIGEKMPQNFRDESKKMIWNHHPDPGMNNLHWSHPPPVAIGKKKWPDVVHKTTDLPFHRLSGTQKTSGTLNIGLTFGIFGTLAW